MGKLTAINNTDTLEIFGTINGASAIATGANPLLTMANAGFTIELMLTCRAIGPGTAGKFSGHLKFQIMNIDTGSVILGDHVVALIDFDSTIDNNFGLSARWVAGSTADSITNADTIMLIQ
jgi:hypothetical protein